MNERDDREMKQEDEMAEWEAIAKNDLFTAQRLMQDLLLDSRYLALDNILFNLSRNKWLEDVLIAKYAVFRDELNKFFDYLTSLFDIIQGAGTVVSMRLDQLTEQSSHDVDYFNSLFRAVRESLDRTRALGMDIVEEEGDILSDALERQNLIDDIAGSLDYDASVEGEDGNVLEDKKSNERYEHDDVLNEIDEEDEDDANDE